MDCIRVKAKINFRQLNLPVLLKSTTRSYSFGS